MNDQQLTEDNFDDVARQAGDALRRPAPADGMAQIRRSRRRQQQMRAAAGGTALAAVIAVGAFVVTRGDDPSPVLTVQPGSTVSPTTTTPTAPTTTLLTAPAPTTAPQPAPTTGDPVPTAAPDDGAGADEVRAWVDARTSEGFDVVDTVAGAGTSARLLVAQRSTDGAAVSAVVLDDGRVVASPRRVTIAPSDLYGLGGAPAIVDYGPDGSGSEVSVWRYDPVADTWATTGDVGIGPLVDAFFGSFTVTVVDDVIVLTNNALVSVDESTVAPSPDQRGVIVRPDLSITPMAPTPDGISTFFNTASGGKAIQVYGESVEGGYGVEVSYDQPWQFDPARNEWSEIPIPDWMTCVSGAPDCAWSEIPDIGADTFAEPTGRGVVVRVPDGTFGLYDATTSTWTRLDDPPVTLWMPTTAVVGDRLIAAPWRSGIEEFGTIAVLDLTTGTWTSEQIDIPADVEARFDTEWFDITWDLRVVDDRVLAAPGPSFQQSPVDPVAVYDTGNGEWTEPTPDDVEGWRSLATRLAG